MENKDQIEIFCKMYPEYLEFKPILALIARYTQCISSIALKKIIEILEEVKKAGKISFIDELLIKEVFYGQKLSSPRHLDEFACFVLPEKMAEDNLSVYLYKFGSFWDCNSEYNNIKRFKILEENGMKYGDKWSKFPMIPFILCAYFYAHLEMFNYDYDTLVTILNNYFDNYRDYIDIYSLSTNKPFLYENAYHYIETIIGDLIINKTNKHI